MLDIDNAANVAQGETFAKAPIIIDGLEVVPPQLTPCSQAAGDAATKLVLGHTGGRVDIFGRVRDFVPGEIVVVNTSGAEYKQGALEFDLGNAVWGTLVAVQHRPTGAVSLLAVLGTLATKALAAKPTFAQIKAALQLDDGARVAICGDIRFHRSADTVVSVATSRTRRPAYTEVALKTESLNDQDDTSTLGAEFHSYIDVTLDLATASAKAAGQLVVDGLSLPPFPYGGYIGAPEYIGTVAGAGASADLTFLGNIDGVPLTGGALQLTLANTAIPAKVSGTAVTAANKFKPGATLDLELDVKTTVFSAGSGRVRFPIYKYTAPR